MIIPWTLRLASGFLLLGNVRSFLPQQPKPTKTTFLSAARYGPPPSSSDAYLEQQQEEGDMAKRKLEFRKVLAMAASDTANPDHLPQLLAKNMELILSLHGEDGAQVISELIEEAKQEGETKFQGTVELVESILSFAEEFVEQAVDMDDENKKLLGKIIRVMTDKDETTRDREDLLDQLFTSY
jgi:hypothetical protein